VRVKPGARSTAIEGCLAGALKVAVSAPPDRGRANEAVVTLLAAALGLPRASVTIVSGTTSRTKVVAVPLDPAAVRAILERLETTPRR
jgi:uncharacterized protein YggU (UPF0235/DUF167 family)